MQKKKTCESSLEPKSPPPACSYTETALASPPSFQPISAPRPAAFIYIYRGIHIYMSRAAAVTQACIECCQNHAAQISNQSALQKKLAHIVDSQGASNLQVIADFDYTLTKFRTAANTRSNECHDVIEHSQYMPPQFRSDFKDVWDDQAALRKLGTWTPETWWIRVHALMVQHGLKREWIKLTVQQDEIAVREGVVEFVEDLERAGVPLTIVSAGLCDVIAEVLHKEGIPSGAMFGNRMAFDEQGALLQFDEPLISSANKNLLGDNPEFSAHFQDLNRSCVLMLGDNPNDCSCIAKLDVGINCVLAIGFLDMSRKGDQLDAYREAFDIIIPVQADDEPGGDPKEPTFALIDDTRNFEPGLPQFATLGS